MRIFVALDIDDAIRERITRFVEGVRGFAPEARWVRPESLHLTLKFIGEKPEEEVAEIKQALAKISAGNFEINFRGYGFFPTLNSARVFWTGIESGPQLRTLAQAVDGGMAGLGIPREEHEFRPHLTLARGGSGSGAPRRQQGDTPNRNFQLLQKKLAALPVPDFGTVTAREFCLYQSQLMRGGSRYTKIGRFPLTQG
jgi:RNA 2',3'-cyclic 3'-phosphodiesterase